MPTYNPNTYTVTYSGNETIPDAWTPERQSLWNNVYDRLKSYLGSQTSYNVNGSIQFRIGQYNYDLRVTSIELAEGILPSPDGRPYKFLRFIFSETIHTGDNYLEVRAQPVQQHAMFLGPTHFTFYEDLVLNITDETYYYLMVDTINIAYALTGCESSNTSGYVNNGDPYVTTLSTVATGYEFTSVVVTMGGNDITASVYDSTTHTINIPRVTRDVVITAVAQLPTYSITYNLTNCTSTNTQTSINRGIIYSTTLTKNVGYEFTLVRVFHNGVDVTSTVYDSTNNTIIIVPTMGDIVITASATQGAISLELYENNAENNRVDKRFHISLVDTISGVLKDVTSITTPSIIIERNTVDFNYVRIPSLNRYYFVEEVVFVKHNLWQVRLKVDVLMSYRMQIMSCLAMIDRNEFDYNDELIDSERVVENDPVIDVIEVSETIFDDPMGIADTVITYKED